MIVRLSPGSPSQWMATRSPLPASTCRSRQLYATLSSPSANHFANGGFDPVERPGERLVPVQELAGLVGPEAEAVGRARLVEAGVATAFAANSGLGGIV